MLAAVKKTDKSRIKRLLPKRYRRQKVKKVTNNTTCFLCRVLHHASFNELRFDTNFSSISDERDAIQKKTFTKWVNKHLKKVSLKERNSHTNYTVSTHLLHLGSKATYFNFIFHFILHKKYQQIELKTE